MTNDRVTVDIDRSKSNQIEDIERVVFSYDVSMNLYASNVFHKIDILKKAKKFWNQNDK